jgi:hypothetical protein
MQSDSNGSSTGPVHPIGCYLADVHGPEVATHPSGLVAYEGCGGDYFIEHPGTTLVDTAQGVGEVREASTLWPGADGIIWLGIGSCCEGSDAACITIGVHAYAFSMEDWLETLTHAFPEAEGLCFGLRVRLEGYAEPRCEPADPECLPIPVCNGHPLRDCCNAPDYDPNKARIPVEPELSEGSCEHDGWCYTNAGGVYCNSIEFPPGAGFTECTDEISEAFCGCVDDQCHWFELG